MVLAHWKEKGLMFEITAGPLPQDRELRGRTSSYLGPPVNGTGSSETLPTHSNSQLTCWLYHYYLNLQEMYLPANLEPKNV